MTERSLSALAIACLAAEQPTQAQLEAEADFWRAFDAGDLPVMKQAARRMGVDFYARKKAAGLDADGHPGAVAAVARAIRAPAGREGMTDALGAARRIAAWADAGKLADDEWLVERNEYAIVDICRAYIALSARCERVDSFMARDRSCAARSSHLQSHMPDWRLHRGSYRRPSPT